jgi:hypothetical protein
MRTLSEKRDTVLHLDILEREMVDEMLVGRSFLVLYLVELQRSSPEDGDDLRSAAL